jgi:hypothetical protein
MNSNRNSAPIKKSFLANYSTTTVIYIVAFLLFGLGCIYLYNVYKDFKKATLATDASRIAQCPDYWDSVGNKKCKNANQIGVCSKTPGADVMDFDNEVFNNSSTGNYAKCKWAKACNTPWSGIERLC